MTAASQPIRQTAMHPIRTWRQGVDEGGSIFLVLLLPLQSRHVMQETVAGEDGQVLQL